MDIGKVVFIEILDVLSSEEYILGDEEFVDNCDSW